VHGSKPETPPSHYFFMRGGALELKGLEAYPHDIYIGFYHRVGMKYVLQKDLLALSTSRPLVSLHSSARVVCAFHSLAPPPLFRLALEAQVLSVAWSPDPAQCLRKRHVAACSLEASLASTACAAPRGCSPSGPHPGVPGDSRLGPEGGWRYRSCRLSTSTL
jgi:hypothetical protein